MPAHSIHPATSPEPIHPSHDWRYSLQLSHSAHAPGIARSTVRIVLHEHDLIPLLDSAELLTSELVTNAYRHTAGEIFLRVGWSSAPETLRLSVWDTSPTHPATAPHTPAPYRTRGRGLFLVRRLSHRWGVHDFSRECRGKAVWAELRLG
ncbi:ATP-binding protein [Streptomyces boncukensis]|uniref:ATP-binding protein n=1 Tax=Streptomyces boncukensis TaxID=2711219 RepID=A0A6G4X7U5_9ACTN|nr:ATP-binding protein [Streptomyces boncukensis]NGO73595.1 ATP-binding protein [Streptomyces boncukensis]